jgi:hypothetical protein
MGSQTDPGRKEEMPATPIPGQVERVLGSSQQLGAPFKHQRRPTYPEILPQSPVLHSHIL